MILFYSDYCPHCRMLIDTIERHDSQRTIKLVSLEALKQKGGRAPPQVTAVPALVLLPSKELLFGKAVFDYLLLPGKGKLLLARPTAPSGATNAPPSAAGPAGEPIAYTIGGGALSDAFAPIEHAPGEMVEALADRAYAWTTLGEEAATPAPADAPFQEQTRSKKSLPDLDSIRAQRELELSQNDLNTSHLMPPIGTR
jgi:hypothetical protein